MSAPKCKALEHIRKYVNNQYTDEVNDPYFWLTDKENPKENSEIIDYLTQENNYTDSIMQDTKELQQEIFSEIKSRLQETDTSAPWPHDNYLYYFRTIKDLEYSLFCRCLLNPKNTIDYKSEEVLLDENILAKDYEFFHIGDEEISPCHQYLAYTVDSIGDEKFTLYIKDIKNNKTYDFTKLANLNYISGHITWSADSKTLLYIELDDGQRPYLVCGLDFEYFLNNNSSDASSRGLTAGSTAINTFTLFTEPDERFWVGTDISRSKEYIFIELESKVSGEIYYLPANNITKNSINNLTLVKPREQDVQYFIEHHVNKNTKQDCFYILINSKQKPNYELFRANIDKLESSRTLSSSSSDSTPSSRGLTTGSTQIGSWEKLIDHDPHTKLEDLDCFQDYCILFTRKNGLNYLNIINNYNFDNIVTYDIESELNEQVYTISSAHNEMYNSFDYRFSYESLSTPDSVYCLKIPDDTNKANNNKIEVTLIKQDEVLNNFNREDYISERIYVEVEKNIKVPISIIYNKHKYKKDGQHPLLLYGYGSYGISIDPHFSHSRISLLDRGIAYAISHIRGGGELGETWHYQGRLDCKKNTFSDFIKSAEFLINNNYTNSNKLIIQGGSAGGLLMGNVINQRPELFHIAIAEVPFVDCLNTMLDPELPLTVTEYEEWGNPSESADIYKYIKSYTPYENITKQDYPILLINNCLEDYRVNYWEAAKWTAKLRATKTDNNTLLLKTQMTAGHCGASGRYQSLYEVAFNYSFILKYLNQ